VLVYTALGAILFTSLEGQNISHHRSLTVEHPTPDTINHLESQNSNIPISQSSETQHIPPHEADQPQENIRKSNQGSPETQAEVAAVISGGEFDTQILRHQTVERLWSITESLNILYRENWTRVVEKELRRYSEELLTSLIRQHNLADEAAASRKRHQDDGKPPHLEQWTFAGSFLYSLTVITTIGESRGA
jgi:hypothetical protein